MMGGGDGERESRRKGEREERTKTVTDGTT